MPRPVRALLSVLACAYAVEGCTFLVTFDDRGDAACADASCKGPAVDAAFDADSADTSSGDAVSPEASACAGLAEGAICGVAATCGSIPTCHLGACSSHVLADGSLCGLPPDACHDAPRCVSGQCASATALPEGTAWSGSDPYARCCAGVPVETTTETNCGVCGWACGAGQTCTLLDGAYLCVGCAADTDCASGCCSTAPTPNHCSPSDCNGSCRTNVCTGGSHCAVGNGVDYCSY